ncbi:MAG: hypothetical protein ACTHOG_12925 [Marmoricola sp.]
MLPRSLLRRRARHRGVRRRSLRIALALLILGSGTAVSLSAPSAEAVLPTVIVPTATCARFDPNLGSGACLRYQSKSGIAYTWLGTYRASNGVPFFCIDYLYDSRISATAARVSTVGLRNQLGRPIGAAEVAALNELISTRAPRGTAGSAMGNAAIALIIRELMSDGIRNDGTVVYPPGLKVHGTVRSVPGGTPGTILATAQSWWDQASQRRGPWHVSLVPESSTPTVPLGQSAKYRLRVTSADSRTLVGVPVSFTCTGPITCPAAMASSASTEVAVQPQGLGMYTITARVTGPSAQGQLLQGAWSAHGGTTALNRGVQRGWIAQRVPASASAQGAAEIVKATPTLVTQAQPSARAGESLSDLVTVAGLPQGYDHPMVAILYGPFATAPTATSCTADKAVASVSIPVTVNGTVRTPTVPATQPGYYVWTESLPGDDRTVGVDTPCGVSEETTVVTTPATPTAAQPTLRTRVSAAVVTLPGTVSDTIAVSGLKAGTLDIAWTLLGPVSPGGHGCTGLDWAAAPRHASGHLTASNGLVRTPAIAITVAGCYTFREHAAATSTSAAADSAPGLPEETALAVRPRPRVVPEVPTGPAGPIDGWWSSVVRLWAA